MEFICFRSNRIIGHLDSYKIIHDLFIDDSNQQSANMLAILNSLRAEGIENEVIEFKEAKNQYDFRKLKSTFLPCATKPTSKANVRLGLYLV